MREPFSRLAMAFLALAACILSSATSQRQDCSGLDCEFAADHANHFQLLQYTMSARGGQDFSEWIGKGGNLIRSGSTSAIPPKLSAGPTWSWTAPNHGIVRGSPIVDSKGAIYQSSIDGELLKFSRQGSLLWTFSTQGVSLPGNPVLLNGVLYSIDTHGKMFGVGSDDGKLLWQTAACEVASGDTHTIIAGEGLVLASCLNKNETDTFGSATTVVACNATDGAVLWKFRPDQHVYNWIGSIQNGSLLFSDALGGTYRLRLKDGSVVWKNPAPSSAVTTTGGLTGASNGLAYVTSNLNGSTKAGLLTAFSAEDGHLVWQRTFPKFPANSGPAVVTHGDRPMVVVAIGTNPGLYLVAGAVLDLDPFEHSADQRHPSKAVALDPQTGKTIWEYDFPDWHGAAAGDSFNHSCLPDSWANPVIAGDGAVFVAGMSGRVYRLIDTDGNGKLEAERGEVSDFDTGNAFQAAPAISEGILAVSPCNGLHVFLS